jgi:FkbM family methyltransferase
MIERLRWPLQVFISRWRNRVHYVLAAPRVYRNWWAWSLPKFGVGVILELRNGLRYLVRPGTTDLSTINDAAINNPYLGSGILKLPTDAVVIDVGANIGDLSIQVAALCPAGQVYAVEPLAENASMIVVNKMLNGLSNIEVLQVALGSHDGEIEMNLAGNASSAYWGIEGSKTEKVRLTSLPELMREHGIEAVDLLKLDCEGAEWDILPSCVDVFSKVRQICMEFHLARGWTPEKLASWLRDFGYKVQHTGGRWNGLLWATRDEA